MYDIRPSTNPHSTHVILPTYIPTNHTRYSGSTTVESTSTHSKTNSKPY